MKIKPSLKRTTLLPVFLLAGLLALPARASAYQIEQLSANPFLDFTARINAVGDVAWIGRSGPDWTDGYGVFLYDAASGQTLQLTGGEPRIDVHGVQLTDNGNVGWDGGWVRVDGGWWDGSNVHSHLFDRATGQVSDLLVGGSTVRGAVVNERGDVLFRDGDEILVQLAPGGEIILLAGGPGYRFPLLLNENGDAAWVEHDSGTGSQGLYLFEAASRNVVRISSATQSVLNPALNNRGDLVWEGRDGTPWQIFFYDHATGTVSQISDDPGGQAYEPRINDRQDVLWTGGAPGFDLFYREGATGEVQRLTDNPYPWYGYWDTDLNQNGDAVWIDWGPPTGTELYLYSKALGRVIRITDQGFPAWPQLNDDGVIVWQGDDPADPSDVDVFRALPPTPASLSDRISELVAAGELDPAAADRMQTDLADAQAFLAAGQTDKAIQRLDQLEKRIDKELDKGAITLETATLLRDQVDLILSGL